MPRKSVISIVVAAVTLLMIGGCGGGGGGGSHHGNNEFAGTYEGTAPLQAGAHGALTVTVSEDGSTVGTLVVSALQGGPSPRVDGIPIGAYGVSGTTSSSGALNLSGLVSGTPFVIAGNVPGATGTGNFSITINETTYNGTIQAESGGDVEADMTFSNATGTNADTSHFPTGAVTANFDTDEADVFLSVTDANGRTFGVTVPNTLDVGDTFTFDSLHKFSTYAQPGSDSLFRDTWAAESGTMTLVARNGTHVSVILTNVHYAAVTFFGNGTGSFNASGSFHN